jgi:hypothetical protein
MEETHQIRPRGRQIDRSYGSGKTETCPSFWTGKACARLILKGRGVESELGAGDGDPLRNRRKGERVGVILDVREYERLMGALEDLADLRAADETLEAIARGEEELLPLDKAVNEMEEERSRLQEAGELPGEKG